MLSRKPRKMNMQAKEYSYRKNKEKCKQSPFTDVEELQHAGKAVVCAEEWQWGNFLPENCHAAWHHLGQQ